MKKRDVYTQELVELDKYLSKNTTKIKDIKSKVRKRGITFYGTAKSQMLYRWNTYISLEVWNNKLVERTFAFCWWQKVKKNKPLFVFVEIMRKIVGNNFTHVSHSLSDTVGGARIYPPENKNNFYVSESWRRDYKHHSKHEDDIEKLDPYYEQLNLTHCEYKNYRCTSRQVPLIKYLTIYQEYPQIELLVKSGLAHLVTEVKRMNKKGKTLEEIFKLPKYLIQALKNGDSLYNVQAQYKIVEKYKFENYNQYLVFKKIHALTKSKQDIKKLFLENTLVIVNYAAKIIPHIHIPLTDYVDYLNFCIKIGINLNERKHLTPPVENLKSLHDDYQKRVDILINEDVNKKIEEAAKKIEKKMKIPKGDYTIVVPKTGLEIKEEGKVLNHCVGGYVDRVVDGTTSIVFIRMKEALDKPFITAELSENKLIQARGDHNGAPDNVDVLSFIKLWCKMSKIKNEIFT